MGTQLSSEKWKHQGSGRVGTSPLLRTAWPISTALNTTCPGKPGLMLTCPNEICAQLETGLAFQGSRMFPLHQTRRQLQRPCECKLLATLVSHWVGPYRSERSSLDLNPSQELQKTEQNRWKKLFLAPSSGVKETNLEMLWEG